MKRTLELAFYFQLIVTSFVVLIFFLCKVFNCCLDSEDNTEYITNNRQSADNNKNVKWDQIELDRIREYLQKVKMVCRI